MRCDNASEAWLVMMSVEAASCVAMELPLNVVAGCGPRHLLAGDMFRLVSVVGELLHDMTSR
jgi:hypothetical protein